MFTLLIFVAVLAVLVLSHEFGHFIAARKNGIKVEEFGFGFPPRIFGIQFFKGKKLEKIVESEEITIEEEMTADGNREIITDKITEIDKEVSFRKWRFVWGNKGVDALREENKGNEGTVYSLNLIPLGGFVNIKGEDGSSPNDADSFGNKKIWQRAIVLVAGVLMNVILATLLLSIGYMVGLPEAISDSAGITVKDRQLAVLQVLPGKPAEAAGVKAGDIILQADKLVNPRVAEFQDYINTHKNDAIQVIFKRGGETLTKDIRPATYADTGKSGLGVAIAEIGLVRYPWYKAIWYGILATGLYIKEIVLAFYLLFKGLFTGAGVGGAVSGPVGVAVMTGQVARMGFAYLVQFTAMLSLNLAILNILPIPALDGGRLLFLFISKITRKPVPQKYEQIIHSVGFLLLMLLVVVITVKDLGAFKSAFVNLFHKIF